MEANIVTGTQIMSTSSKFRRYNIDEGDSNITQHGHCWSVNQNPTLTSNNGLTLLGDVLIGLFSSTIDDLNAIPFTIIVLTLQTVSEPRMVRLKY